MFQLDTAPPHRVLGRTQSHLYLAPHPVLGGCVAHYTITFPGPQAQDMQCSPGMLRILPDASGCLVFSLDERRQGRFWGATTHTVEVQKDFSVTPMRFFVEFLPGGAHRLFGLHMRQMADKTFLLDDVLPHVHNEMGWQVRSTQDIGQLLWKIDGLLLEQMAGRERDDTAAGRLLPLLTELGGHAPVRALADATGYSERHLGRLFEASIGLSIKVCQRVLRINRVLAGLRPGVPLTRLAQTAGYYDQAHLNHDFKAICGVSPSEYLVSVSDFYKESYKF